MLELATIKMKGSFISFIIPARNEEGSIEILYKEIAIEAKKLKTPFEIIFVDDGSTDKTLQKLQKIHKFDKRTKIISLRGWQGKSVALKAGFEESVGSIIITLDADLQDNPKEIQKFLNKLNEGYDLVSGWKKKRHDPINKVIPSKIFNLLIKVLTGIKIHDVNCGFKAYRREVLENISFYGDLYRFIPILAFKQNFKVAEIAIAHRRRRYGKSKFGFERYLKGFLDLLTIFFLTTYTKRPGHFFGSIGLVSFLLGFVIGIYITYLRISTGSIQYRQPLLFLGVLLMILGVQLISTGLLAEMINSFMQKDSSSKKFVSKILD